MRTGKGTTLTVWLIVLLGTFAVTARVEAASLKVSSFPSGAKVTVDGVDTGMVTPMTIAVPEGDHVVTVSIPGSGWKAETQIVTIAAGINTLNVTLVPTVVAPADGPCVDDSSRYVDCGNGTVTDTVTGLIWLKNVDCFGYLNWTAANGAAAALADGQCGLTDGSSPGTWRLPSKDEWLATVAQAVTLGCRAPALTNDAGTECFGDGTTSSFPRVAWSLETAFFWSSSTNEQIPDWAHVMFLINGSINTVSPVTGCNCKVSDNGWFRPWPVRDGRK